MPKTPTRGRGYDQLFAQAVMALEPNCPAVQLAQLCVARNIPAEWVAEQLGVSRTTVYWWFLKTRSPRPKNNEAIDKLITNILSGEVQWRS